jgi:hypothetical protein
MVSWSFAGIIMAEVRMGKPTKGILLGNQSEAYSIKTGKNNGTIGFVSAGSGQTKELSLILQ